MPLFAAIVIMLALGAGSAQGPVEQLAAELIGLGLIIAPALHARWRTLYGQDRPFAWLAIALVALFIAQLVPLPAALWHAWPGRALFANGDTLMVGHGLSRPLALEPDETVAALVFLIPALAIWLRGRLADDFTDLWILAWLAFLAGSLLLALAQVSAQPGEWHLYANSHSGLPTGLFANRNHQAIAMASGIPLAAGLNRKWHDLAVLRRRPSPGGLLFGAVAAGAVVGALLTGSRTGCALLVPALLAANMIYFGGRGTPRQTRLLALATLAGLVVVVLAAVALSTVQPGGALGLLLTRSYTADDDRYAFWPVVIRMIAKYMPWGTGFGSFRRAFEIDEPTGLLSPLSLNHAHNDWLEFTLEAGLAGVVLAAGFVIWLIARWWPTWRGAPGDPQRQAAGTVIALLLAHSCFDYPLRTVALSACCAACIAVLSRPQAPGAGGRHGHQS
jgi:O-antigen ligase